MLRKFARSNFSGITIVLFATLLVGCTSGPDEYAKDACRVATVTILFEDGSSEFEMFTTASRSDDAAVKAAGQKGEIGVLASDSAMVGTALAQLMVACKNLDL